ncbi:MAG: DNA adenine methylase [Bacteroides sp.]|nr:DNA adenine methylase [Bacteroides sp.]MCM1413282.1 DNA adenine methylase [Bacteroides sp.]MCM1471408.1 DNA adenine methylase [Bacteroides sp.]
MKLNVPHIVQYQGSKRSLAPQILQYFPSTFSRLIEPFAGMAAITMAVAYRGMSQKFVINDLNSPLVELIRAVVEQPEAFVKEYTELWNEQFEYSDGYVQHYYKIRSEFNEGQTGPAHMMYLLARCVKGSVRYGNNGLFNQSPDKRRHGTRPQTLLNNARQISSLLKGKTTFLSEDYRQILDTAVPGDIVYMDPPYQGVCSSRDNRYFAGIDFNHFVEALENLNRRNIDYIISYDGSCGDKHYGTDLPTHLNLKKILLKAGLSSQSLLLGKKEVTLEALYISRGLQDIAVNIPIQKSLFSECV